MVQVWEKPLFSNNLLLAILSSETYAKIWYKSLVMTAKLTNCRILSVA